MGWRDYYNLLVKYGGDLSKASEEELREAEKANPNNPYDALMLALRKYKEEFKGNGTVLVEVDKRLLEGCKEKRRKRVSKDLGIDGSKINYSDKEIVKIALLNYLKSN
jgi:hypothetical protein